MSPVEARVNEITNFWQSVPHMRLAPLPQTQSDPIIQAACSISPKQNATPEEATVQHCARGRSAMLIALQHQLPAVVIVL